jgi:hypothetical protein
VKNSGADGPALHLLDDDGFHHRAGTDAAGAYTNLLGTPDSSCNPNFLQIRQPAPSGLVMSVTDIIAGNWFFAADFA